MQIEQSRIIGLIKNENILKSYLLRIEKAINSDVISYYGLISEDFIDCLLIIAKETKLKSNRERLTIILKSRGGETKHVRKFYEEIYKIYNELFIVVNEEVLSAATVLSFSADKLFVLDTDLDEYQNGKDSFFGMIDPQLLANHPDGRTNVYTSAFYFIGGAGFEYSLVDTDELSTSFTYKQSNNLENFCPFIHQYLKEICFGRNLSFDGLIKNSLKNEGDKQKIAISIINHLMDVTKHNHDDKISFRNLEEKGLRINRFSKNEIDVFDCIQKYNESIYKYLHRDINTPSSENDFGNKLHCLIQSVNQLII